MSNSEIDQKALLRQSTARKIFASSSPESFKEPIFHLFSSLIEFEDALEVVLQEIQKQRPFKLLENVLDVLFTSFSKRKNLNKDQQQKLVKAIFSSIDVNLPAAYTKTEPNALQLLEKAADFCSLFPDISISEFQKQQQNPNLVAFYLLILSHFDTIKDENEFVKPYLQQKLSQNFLSFSHYFFLSKHIVQCDSPPFKSIVSSFKSITDEQLFSMLASPMLRSLVLRLDAQNMKELPSLLSYIPRRLRKDPNGAIVFWDLLQKSFEFPDAIATLKPFLEDILSIYLITLKKQEIPKQGEIDNLDEYFTKEIGDIFMNLCTKFEYLPFESYFQAKSDSHPVSVLLMAAFIILHSPIENVQEKWLDTLLNFVQSNKNAQTMMIMVHVAFFFCKKFESKRALKYLIQCLEQKSETSAKFLLSDELSFDFVFEEMASQFKPDSSPDLYLKTLITFMKKHFTNSPEIDQSDKSDIPDSDSNFDLLPRFNTKANQDDDEEIDSIPTTKTILFCSVLSALQVNPALGDLLPLAASALSPAFAKSLTEKLPKPTQQRFHLDAIAAFGTALQLLDKQTINAIALTFLMLKPDQSMVYLGITLQRLPRKVADACLKKTLPFATEYPDEFGRMIALVSFVHPSIALNFLNRLENDSQSKKRVFLFFRSSEADEKTLIMILKAIGSCSNFIDESCFIDEFLNFATNFLNKHLTGTQLPASVNEAALYAIKKLSTKIASWQSEHTDHVFPFKDFLVQYVCTYYLDIGESILSANEQPKSAEQIPIIISALAALLPIRPVRISEKELRTIELTAVLLQVIAVDTFPTIIKATRVFFCSAIDSTPTLSIFIATSKPVFPALLMHSEWQQIAQLLSVICSRWEKISLVDSTENLSWATNEIGVLISYALPLLISDVGKTAADIVFALHSLLCAIRNQILSLPKSIRPQQADYAKMSPEELCSSVCATFAKPLLTPQIFEVITSLIKLFENNKVLEIHYKGIALAVEQLIALRGSEEFRYDSEIVTGLCKAIEGKTPDVKEIIIRSLNILFKMRLVSVISCLMGEENISNDLFTEIIKQICSIKQGDKQLLEEISKCISSDAPATSVIQFAERSLPLLKSAIDQSSNEVYARLLIGIFKRPPESRSALLSPIIGNDVKAFALYVVSAHKGSLKLIAQEKLELDITIALAFAAVSDDTCSDFLEPIIPKIKTEATPEQFSVLRDLLKSRDPHSYASLIPSLSAALLHNLSKNEAFECAVALLNKCTDEQKKPFLEQLAKLEKEEPKEIIHIATKFFEQTKPSVEVLVPLLPYAAVTADIDFVAILASFVGARMREEEIRQTIDDILVSDKFEAYKHDLLSAFVSYINEGQYLDDSLHFILVLCKELDQDNAFAIETVVEKLPLALSKESDEMVSSLIQILS